MAYFNYNNARLRLGASTGNASPYFCENLGISLNSQIEPVYLAPDKSSFDYAANKDINGSLSLSYYLTGQDPLREFTTNEKTTITGDFAGLTFKSGYLTSYSFNFSFYQPVLINANIQFYGGVEGTFTPTKEENTTPENVGFLNYSDCTISNKSGAVYDSLFAVDASYNFSSQIDPVYLAGEILPREVRFQKKQTSITLNTYNLETGITLSGEAGEIQFDLKDSGVAGTVESFKVRGRLNSQNISASAGRKILTTISLNQESVGDAPVFASFNPASAATGTQIIISGENLENTVGVNFENAKATGFGILSPTGIVTYVPEEAIDGPIILETIGGKATSTGSFDVVQPSSFWNALG